MKLNEAIDVLKANTLPINWPDAKMGRVGTDWQQIQREVRMALREEIQRQGIDPDAMFFVLDESDPGTRVYNEIMEAWQVVRSCVRNTTSWTRVDQPA
jgi:hypothetical protein